MLKKYNKIIILNKYNCIFRLTVLLYAFLFNIENIQKI